MTYTPREAHLAARSAVFECACCGGQNVLIADVAGLRTRHPLIKDAHLLMRIVERLRIAEVIRLVGVEDAAEGIQNGEVGTRPTLGAARWHAGWTNKRGERGGTAESSEEGDGSAPAAEDRDPRTRRHR